MRRLATLCLLLAGIGGLSACSSDEAAWRLKDISGVMPPLQLELTNTAGETVTADDYRGKIVLLYFGYTSCPDICPATLGNLRHVMERLGKDADQVRILFVTVDPQRDTRKKLGSYTGFFGPQFVGLRGDDSALQALTKRYRVTYSRGTPDPKTGNYPVTHSSAIFVFDRSGKARLLAGLDDGVDAISHDLARLLDDGRA